VNSPALAHDLGSNPGPMAIPLSLVTAVELLPTSVEHAPGAPAVHLSHSSIGLFPRGGVNGSSTRRPVPALS